MSFRLLFWGYCLGAFVTLGFAACRSTTRATAPRDYAEFSQYLAKAINERDADFFNRHFDFDALLHEITDHVIVPPDYKEGFIAGMKQQLNVGQQIVGSLGADGAYHFLRLKPNAEQSTALFRQTTSDGINYHEIKLGMRGDSCYIKDFYIYRGGLDFSATLKRIYFASLSGVDNDSVSFANTSPFDRAFIENLTRIDEIAELTQNNQYDKALAIADALPDILRSDKMILVMRTNIAYHVGKDAFETTLADFRDHYPSDAVVEFIALDLSFESKDPDLILQRIDELDAKLGGDPYLDIIRASLYETQDNYDAAEKLYRKAMAAEPDNEELPFRLCLFLIKQKRYEETTALFADIYKRWNYNPAIFLVPAENQEFWESEAYQNWEKQHPWEEE